MFDILTENEDVVEYLHRHESKDLLRFVVVGSVDDGKSTLIGRLLHDAQGIYEDQLAAVKRAAGGAIDFSLFTDGLLAEREQKITIDVAYRYFATRCRKFIVADTPGHVQYTRNMATGASTADVALILIDARHGVLPQTRRHALLASMVGVEHLLVCVNKMDLVDWDPNVFSQIEKNLRAFLETLRFRETTFIAVSALLGSNIVDRAPDVSWFDGPTVLEYLETVPLRQTEAGPLRLPVQLVLRPHLDYRGFAGQLASGRVAVGDTVALLPSGRTSRVKSLTVAGADVPSAEAPLSVALTLHDEIDVSRGDMIVAADDRPTVTQDLAATLVCLHEVGLVAGKPYLLKHTSRSVRCQIRRIDERIDLENLSHVPASRLDLNDVAEATLSIFRPLFVDGYETNRTTGSFVLIDPVSNDTVAAGMVRAAVDRTRARGSDEDSALADRRGRLGYGPCIVILATDAQGFDVWAARATDALLELGIVPITLPNGSLSKPQEARVVESIVRAGHVAIVPERAEFVDAPPIVPRVTLSDEASLAGLREQLSVLGVL